jgi:UDP-N-acetylmuramoyl-tripeptide--D-alanyl-D-alanine ligase
VSESRFLLREAARELEMAGLLAGCLVVRDGVWQTVEPAGLPSAAGFQGGGLDSRTLCPDQLFIALPGRHVDGREHVHAALVGGAGGVLALAGQTGGGPAAGRPAPGLQRSDDRAAAVLLTRVPERALARLAAVWRRRCSATRLTAVTGSNGKTTTKDLLAAMCGATGSCLATAGNLNNELGLPLTVLGLRPDHRRAVVEMGASSEGEIARLAAVARPDLGVITNAAEAHLAAFGSLDGVVRGKGELLSALPADGLAVLNADSPGFAAWSARAVCAVVSFGRQQGRHRWSWQPAGESGRIQLDGATWQLPLPGEHNGANLVAAILAARGMGVADAEIAAGLRDFHSSPHRSQLISVGEILLLDDSYNANPVSVIRAATALANLAGTRRVAVLGEMAELGSGSDELHERTGRQLAALGLELLVTVGAAAEPLHDGFCSAGGTALHFPDRPAAAAWLREHLVAGDRVLIKGSRVARMEQIATDLVEGLSGKAAPAGPAPG